MGTRGRMSSTAMFCALTLLVLVDTWGGGGTTAPFIDSDGVALLHQNFTLKCCNLDRTLNEAELRYEWYLNSSPIPHHSSPELHFPNVTEVHQGVYTCAVWNEETQTLSPQSKPVVLRTYDSNIPRPYLSHHGTPVASRPLTLVCYIRDRYSPTGNPIFTWYKNDVKVKVLSRHNFHFPSVEETDAGVYTCRVTDGDDTSPPSNTFSMTPLIQPDLSIKAESPGSAIKGTLGENLTLTCNATRAFPPVPWNAYSWSYLPSPEQPLRPLAGNASTLTLGPLTREDGGQYFCQARNDQGFSGLNLIGNTSVTVHIVYLQNITLTSDLEVDEGDRVTLTCSVDSQPTAHLNWVVHGREARQVIDNRDHYFIQSASCSDSTNYTCLASNTDLPGRDLSATCNVVVRCSRGSMEDAQQPDQFWGGFGLAIGLVILAVLVFVIVKYRSFTRARQEQDTSEQESLKEGDTEHNFETLYKDGQTYVFPPLTPPNEADAAETDEESHNEKSPLLSKRREGLKDGDSQFRVKDSIRFTLQTLTEGEDPPSFLLHNTRLSRQDDVILALGMKLGVVLIVVGAVEDVKMQSSTDQALRRLVEVRKKVRKRLEGLVKPEAVRAVLALPNLPLSEMEDVRRRLKNLSSDVEVLLDQGRTDFHVQTKKLISEPASIWDHTSAQVDSPEAAYKKAAGNFLTLTGCSPPGESPRQPAAEESWLLTPAQLKVRDSTARLLHIWGPPGSGKTTLLIQKAREWLAEGKAVVLAVGREFYDLRLVHTREAVLRGQDKEARKRIRVCRTTEETERTVMELKGRYPKTETCVIVDVVQGTEGFRSLLSRVKSKKLDCVWSTCRGNLHTLDKKLSEEARQLGWESARLPHCIRCTKSTVELLNLLVQGSPDYTDIPACILPRARDIPAWRVVDHCLHPQHTSTTFCCPQCRVEMSAALPYSAESREWKDWIALHTGNLEIFIDFEPLHEALENVGVPNVYKSTNYNRSYFSTTSNDPKKDTPGRGFDDFRENVIAGTDDKGKPVVHLISCTDFRGLEKAGVIVVHWDERDNDPGRQSQGERETRLREHSQQWLDTVSSSKGQVILLLLSPSPARTLLNLPEAVLPQGGTEGQAASSPRGQQEAKY